MESKKFLLSTRLTVCLLYVVRHQLKVVVISVHQKTKHKKKTLCNQQIMQNQMNPEMKIPLLLSLWVG